MSRRPVFICGGDDHSGDRDACPDSLHDWPLPNGYSDAAASAASRLSRRWANVRCRRCGLYGWSPGRIVNEVRVEAS